MSLQLPLIYPYPFNLTRALTIEERLLENLSVRPIVGSMPSPEEHARHVGRNYPDNGTSNDFVDALQVDRSFAAARSSMPPLNRVQGIDRYRHAISGGVSHLSAQADGDLQAIDTTLSPGQVVFHGGVWPSTPLVNGSTFVSAHVLSTSLNPKIAGWHAYRDGDSPQNRQLWILRVNSPGVRAYIYALKGHQFGHEAEVLLQAGILVRLISLESHMHFTLVFAEI